MSKKAKKLKSSSRIEAETAKKEMDKLSKSLKRERRSRVGTKKLYTSNYQNKQQ